MSNTPTSKVLAVLASEGVQHPDRDLLAVDLVGAARHNPEQVAELLDTAGVGAARSPETQALAANIVRAVKEAN